MPRELTPRALEIVAAARALLTEQGRDALTMRAVAERIGIRAPSLYKHFEDKQALETALIAEGFAEQALSFERAATAVPPERRLAALARAYRTFARAEPDLYRLMTDAPLRRDLLPEGLEARAARPLVEATGDGDLARAAFAFAHGMVTLELAGRFPPDADLDAAWQRGIDALSTSPGVGRARSG